MSYFFGSDNSKAVGAEIEESKDGRLLLSLFGGKHPYPGQFEILVLLYQRPFPLGGLL